MSSYTHYKKLVRMAENLASAEESWGSSCESDPLNAICPPRKGKAGTPLPPGGSFMPLSPLYAASSITQTVDFAALLEGKLAPRVPELPADAREHLEELFVHHAGSKFNALSYAQFVDIILEGFAYSFVGQPITSAIKARLRHHTTRVFHGWRAGPPYHPLKENVPLDSPFLRRLGECFAAAHTGPHITLLDWLNLLRKMAFESEARLLLCARVVGDEDDDESIAIAEAAAFLEGFLRVHYTIAVNTAKIMRDTVERHGAEYTAYSSIITEASAQLRKISDTVERTTQETFEAFDINRDNQISLAEWIAGQELLPRPYQCMIEGVMGIVQPPHGLGEGKGTEDPTAGILAVAHTLSGAGLEAVARPGEGPLWWRTAARPPHVVQHGATLQQLALGPDPALERLNGEEHGESQVVLQAAHTGDVQSLREALEQGMDPDSCLHGVHAHGQGTVLNGPHSRHRYRCSPGDVHTEPRYFTGRSALELAVQAGHHDCVQALVEYRAAVQPGLRVMYETDPGDVRMRQLLGGRTSPGAGSRLPMAPPRAAQGKGTLNSQRPGGSAHVNSLALWGDSAGPLPASHTLDSLATQLTKLLRAQDLFMLHILSVDVAEDSEWYQGDARTLRVAFVFSSSENGANPCEAQAVLRLEPPDTWGEELTVLDWGLARKHPCAWGTLVRAKAVEIFYLFDVEEAGCVHLDTLRAALTKAVYTVDEAMDLCTGGEKQSRVYRRGPDDGLLGELVEPWGALNAAALLENMKGASIGLMEFASLLRERMLPLHTQQEQAVGMGCLRQMRIAGQAVWEGTRNCKVPEVIPWQWRTRAAYMHVQVPSQANSDSQPA